MKTKIYRNFSFQLTGRQVFLLITVFLFLFSEVLSVSGNPEFVEEAFKKIENLKMEEYAYTLTTVKNGKKSAEQYDPLLEDECKWQLLSINDTMPTPKELQDYRTNKLKEQKNRHEQGNFGSGSKKKQQNLSMSYKDFMGKDSLKLLTETETVYTYSFKPGINPDNPMSKMMHKLEGILRLNKSGKYIEYIFIYTPGSFSPYFGVEVKKFSMEMSFAPINGKGNIVLNEAKTQFQGSAFLISHFDENMVATYSDYIYKGKSNPDEQ